MNNVQSFLIMFLVLFCVHILQAASKIPVIIDTDLGTDMDDSWAIAFLLQSPEVDVKLIVTETHDTAARTKVLAKMLFLMNRTDVPIGVGPQQDNSTGPVSGALYGWATDYDLSTYPGTIYPDGVAAMNNAIMNNNGGDQMVILEIAPCPNVQYLLQRFPQAASRVRIVAMGGSVRIGYSNTDVISAEYNIADDVAAATAMYAAQWSIITAPLDVTIYTQMTGEPYDLVKQSESLAAQVVMQQFQYWFNVCSWRQAGIIPTNPVNVSSTLHDLVAATMIFTEQDLVLSPLDLSINATGFTLITPPSGGGRLVQTALAWFDLSDWFMFTAKRIATPSSR